jgi:GNAT superfamily N-acetyltransferase
MITVRDATSADAHTLYALIRELAEFEKILQLVETNADKLASDLEADKFRALMAEKNGQPIGYAIYDFVYFSFNGRWLYLDDLYVKAEHRGSGAGRLLLRGVGEKALAEGCFGVQWFVLDWNERAMRFYEAAGATLNREWLVERVRGPEAIRTMIARLSAGC